MEIRSWFENSEMAILILFLFFSRIFCWLSRSLSDPATNSVQRKDPLCASLYSVQTEITTSSFLQLPVSLPTNDQRTHSTTIPTKKWNNDHRERAIKFFHNPSFGFLRPLPGRHKFRIQIAIPANQIYYPTTLHSAPCTLPYSPHCTQITHLWKSGLESRRIGD